MGGLLTLGRTAKNFYRACAVQNRNADVAAVYAHHAAAVILHRGAGCEVAAVNVAIGYFDPVIGVGILDNCQRIAAVIFKTKLGSQVKPRRVRG